MAANEGSPNWHWQQLGYQIERTPTPFGNRRTIRRPDGSEVIIDQRKGEHRADAEVRSALLEETMGWNPRFIAFCHSIGMTPEQYKAAGLGNVDFIAWSSRHVREWKALGNTRHVNADGAYDVWLSEKYPPPRLPHGATECAAAQLDIFHDIA